MKKFTAVLLLILTICFVGVALYLNREAFGFECNKTSSSVPMVAPSSDPQINGILPGGCVVKKESPERLLPIKQRNNSIQTKNLRLNQKN